MADESQELEANFGLIIERLGSSLGPLEGEPRPLEGGITNRNYVLPFGGTRYVVRVPGKDTSLLGIDREAERAANELAAELGIAPRVAGFLADPPCIVTEFVDGTGMDAEELRGGPALAQVAAGLRRLHDCGRRLPARFDSFAVVDDYAATARSRGDGPPAEEYRHARAEAARIRAALTGPEHEPVPCHNDLLAANFIRGERLWVVDWEYAGMGDRWFDLANFAVNNELDEPGERAFLAEYFGEEPGERRTGTLRVMRFMSDFREAMWGVVQAAVSELDFDFHAYARQHFERMRATASDPAYESRLEAASEPAL